MHYVDINPPDERNPQWEAYCDCGWSHSCNSQSIALLVAYAHSREAEDNDT